VETQPKIRKLKPQAIIFVRKYGEYINAAPKPAWSELMIFAEKKKLIKKHTKKIGICHDNRWSKPEKNLRYDACITIDKTVELDENISNQTIQGGKYLVFLHSGPFEYLDKTYKKIFDDWLPHKKTKIRTAPTLEFYLNCEEKFTNPQNLKTEIWIPIEN